MLLLAAHGGDKIAHVFDEERRRDAHWVRGRSKRVASRATPGDREGRYQTAPAPTEYKPTTCWMEASLESIPVRHVSSLRL